MMGKPRRDDPAERFARVVAAFAGEPRLAPIAKAYAAEQARGGARKFGSDALKVKGKMFAFLSRDRLVLKLPRERVGALVAAGAGELFDPGHGRLMQQWVVVLDERAAWEALAREAYDFVKRTA
jgi:hypothetical protein